LISPGGFGAYEIPTKKEVVEKCSVRARGRIKYQQKVIWLGHVMTIEGKR
jgi:hypothetical protein